MRPFSFSCLVGIGLSLAAAPAPAVTVPAGFAVESLPFTFDLPTAIAFLPDGRLLVAEKGGIVYVVTGATRHPLWVGEEEVLNTDDRGLLAIAVDPDFETNRFLYFLYTVDPDSNGIELDNYDDAFARLTRYQASASDPNVVDLATRTVLIGRTWREGFASGSGTHSICALEWGSDGSLLVSAGDGAHHDQVDAGGLDPGLFAPERTDPLEDIGAFRAQDLRSLDGKLLRIDPATGLGYPGNPFFDGDPASNRSRVWAYGMRNPFRVARKPGTGATDPADDDPGTLYVGDVGWITWEEIHVVRTPGPNFGWPCFEGREGHPDYHAATPAHHDCGSIGTPVNPSAHELPVVALHRWTDSLSVPAGAHGGVIAGGVFYSGMSYPLEYRDRYFFGDFTRDWIKVLVTDEEDRLVSLIPFAAGAGRPVAFATDPLSGDLFYVAIGAGEVRRIRYLGVTSVEPTAGLLALSPAHPNPSAGAIELTIDLARAEGVSFAVYDQAGRQIWRAPDHNAAAGRVVLAWTGVTRSGERAASGVYFARVRVDGEERSRRFILLR